MPANASYLKSALDSTYKVEAIVKNPIDSDKATAVATSFWLEKHNLSKSRWHILTVDLTLSSHQVSSMGPQYMTQRSLGILQHYTLHGFDEPNTLVIYSSDQYTDNWVHEWAAARTLQSSSRILNIVRQDTGNAIDLGSTQQFFGG